MKFGRAAQIGLGVAGGVGMAAAAIHGVGRGMGSNNISDSFYELTTGNPNIDQDILGTRMGVREAMFPYMGPFAGEITRRGIVSHGGIEGLIGGYQTGLLNQQTITDQFTNASKPLLSNEQMAQYRNRPPTVDGSIVFGQYNSRMS